MGRGVIKGRNITTHWSLDRWVIEEQGTYLQGKEGKEDIGWEEDIG